MKLLKSIILFLFLVPSTLAYSQSNKQEYPKNTVYIEFGGAGVTYSLNYDYRLTKGIALRSGVNYAPTLLAPGVGLIGQGSYLFGKEGKFFELGIGITYVLSDNPNVVPFSDNEFIKGTLINSFIGYRSQSLNQPVFFRIGLTPFYSFFTDTFLWSAGLSFGYSF